MDEEKAKYTKFKNFKLLYIPTGAHAREGMISKVMPPCKDSNS
jgi:hypothetical protein